MHLCCLLCPAAGWEEQLAIASSPASTEATASAECSRPYVWVAGVIAGLLLIAAVAILILAVILAILWRIIICMTKYKQMQQDQSTAGNMAKTAGLLALQIWAMYL